jgi:hypothetical protein
MSVIGHRLQRANWKEIVETLVEASGGRAVSGVQVAEETLEGDAAARVDAWLRELALSRKRAENTRAVAADDPAGEVADAVTASRDTT